MKANELIIAFGLTLAQQGLSIFAVVLGYQAIVIWIHGMQGQPVHGSAVWTAALTSMLLWPWVFIVLRDTRRKHQVA